MLERMTLAGCGVLHGSFQDRNLPERQGYRYCIVQVDQGHGDRLESEVPYLLDHSTREFVFCSVEVSEPNEQLSPWSAPAVFREPFGSGADSFLATLTGRILPVIRERYSLSEGTRYIVGGYSLAGLFALWAAYETDYFHGVAAVSPSVWFPGWEEYICSRRLQAKRAYLSLGNKERKTRIGAMQKVEANIVLQHERFRQQLGDSACCLEWNEGNHFQEPDIRMAKGLSWILREPGF